MDEEKAILQEVHHCPRAILALGVNNPGYPLQAIFSFKQEDVQKLGFTIYRINSSKATVDMVQQFGKGMERLPLIILEPTSDFGDGPQHINSSAKFYSSDSRQILPIPERMNRVRGTLGSNTCGLTLSGFRRITAEYHLNLLRYEDFSKPGSAIDFEQWSAAACAVKSERQISGGMQTFLRKILAVGWVCSPFGVWLYEDY